MHDRAGGPSGSQGAARIRRAAVRVVGGIAALATVAGVSISTTDLIASWRAERTARDGTAVATTTGDAIANELGDLRAALRAADLQRATAEAGVVAAISGLVVAENDRQAVVAELDRLRAELVSLRGAVAGTEQQAQATAALVGPLGECLDGVSRLLNQVAVGDPAAGRTAEAIGPACAAVGMVLQ